MALKQIMLSKKIEQRKNGLKTLLEKRDSLKTRSSELETALEEAQTDEEIATVEEEVNTLEADEIDNEGKIKGIEDEIAELEVELEKLNTNEPKPEPKVPEERNKNLGGEIRMGAKKFFTGMSIEARSSFLAREEVKDFLVRTRELIGQKRSVNGAELTIPEIVLDLLRDNLHRYSKLISKVNLKPVAGKARQNIAGAIPEAIWTEATGILNELSINFGQVEVDGYKVGGFIPVPNSILEDSDLNLANEIMDALGQAIGYAIDKAILYGTGSKMPLGIATRLSQASKPSDWGKNAPTWVDLRTTNLLKINPSGMSATDFFAALILNLSVAKPNYSNGEKFWVMNSKTKAVVLSKAISFNAAGALVAGTNGTMPIIGGDIVELEFVADNDIIGGYGSAYLLAERAGANLSQSEHVKFIEDQTVFKGTARYDGMPVFGEAFVIANIANTNPTTSVAFAPDTANPSDAYLNSLVLGSLTLAPIFDPAVGTYATTTTNTTNTITATAAKENSTVEIKLNGSAHANGAAATWTSGANTVEITVKNGTTTKVYTIAVTKS
jgi:HK97 family phage major capsid protein